MILSTSAAKALAWATALALHGVLILAVTPDPQLRIAGGATSVEARLGNSFADFAVGTLQALSASVAAQPPVKLAQPAMAPVAAMAETGKAVVSAPAVPAARVARPVVAELAAVPDPAQTAARAVAAEPSAGPETPQAASGDRARKWVIAETPQTADPARSPRPRLRSAEVEDKAAKASPAAQATPRGNADRTTRAGSNSSSGTARASSAARSPKPAARAPGNAAASNYPGKVMGQLRRIGTLRLGVKGAVVVQFTIASGGGLSGIGVSRSSGSPRLDRAAVRAIRQAAPFPKPPPGARRTFSLTLRGT